MARGIRLTAEDEDEFTTHLHAIGYSWEDGLKARLWILYGDWTFRGTSPRLLLSDFFPTVQQLEPLVKAMDMVVMTRGEYALLRRLSDRGRVTPALGDKNATSEPLDGKNDMSVLAEQVAKRYAAEERVEEIGKQLTKAEAEIARLNRLVEKLRESHEAP